jgi:signal transduction histidine kinase
MQRATLPRPSFSLQNGTSPRAPYRRWLGIPAGQRAQATALSIRLDERSDGHSFGLAIVWELAELHGRTLSLRDAPGGGVLASVSLPDAG